MAFERPGLQFCRGFYLNDGRTHFTVMFFGYVIYTAPYYFQFKGLGEHAWEFFVDMRLSMIRSKRQRLFDRLASKPSDLSWQRLWTEFWHSRADSKWRKIQKRRDEHWRKKNERSRRRMALDGCK